MSTTACPGCHRVLPVRPGLYRSPPVAHVDPRGLPCPEVTGLGLTTGAAFRGLAMDWLLGVEVGPSSPVRWDLPPDSSAPRLEECGRCHTLTGSGISHLYVCPGTPDPSCGYCGSTSGYDTSYDGWSRCRDCGGC